METEILDDENDIFVNNIYNFIDFFVARYLNINDDKNVKFNENFLSIEEIRVKKNMCEKMCSICIDNLKVNQKVKLLPCNHIFHKNCLFKWAKKSSTCPECRQNMVKQ